MTTSHKCASFHWDDPFLLDAQLSDDERTVRDAASASTPTRRWSNGWGSMAQRFRRCGAVR